MGRMQNGRFLQTLLLGRQMQPLPQLKMVRLAAVVLHRRPQSYQNAVQRPEQKQRMKMMQLRLWLGRMLLRMLQQPRQQAQAQLRNQLLPSAQDLRQLKIPLWSQYLQLQNY